jgi:hypothetical protein
MTWRALPIASALILAGCATTQGPQPIAARSAPTSEFRVSDFAWSAAPGRGVLDGRLGFRAGAVAYNCLDAGVVLTPETPWTRSRMEILYKSASSAALPAAEVRGRTPPGRSSDYSAFVKHASCDASGHFAFTGLADGAWFVITVAKPTAPGTGADMAIMRRIVVRGGGKVDVKL